MLTYQDLIAVGTDESKRIEWVRTAIDKHRNSDAFKTAQKAQDYDKRQNTTVVTYQKLLYKLSGEAVPDNYSANHKICSNFFNRFVTQETQYLLGNGVTWDKDAGDRLGDDFDSDLQNAAHKALVDGVSFGFWNYDHLEVFRLTEFMPLYDEEDGAMKAGIRFWQIDNLKPLRATLYELDGYTEYIWRVGEDGEVLRPKRKYVLRVRTSPVDGTEIFDGENYPSFPIVPLWANIGHQSELVGIQEGIDAYDLIKSGFANDVDDASLIYWTINNAGGMDDIDLAQFVQRMRTVKAAVVSDDGASAQAHTVDVPFGSKEALLSRIRNDLYDDYMALDTKVIVGGAATATQIKAAYEPLNSKADAFEYCVLDFLNGIMFVAGIEDNPSFTRSMIVNTQEMVQVVLQCTDYLSSRYITEKILSLLGDSDQLESVLKEKEEEEAVDRFEPEVTNGNDSKTVYEQGASGNEEAPAGNLQPNGKGTAGEV